MSYGTDVSGSLYYSRYVPRPQDAHPLYAKHSWWWRFYELHYLGGPEYYAPDISQSWLHPIRFEDQAREGLRYEERWLRSFLFPFNREETGDYDQRIMRAFRLNFCRPVVDTYVAHLFSRPILRDHGTALVLDDVWKDVDGRGHSIAEWMAEGVTSALIFGHALGVIDATSAANGSAATLADQAVLGLRPTVTWFSPLQVVDWQMDARGHYEWVRIAEPAASVYARQPGTPPVAKFVFRTWYADHWTLEEYVRTGGRRMQTLAEGPNALGVVPVVVLYREREPGSSEPVGVSMLSDIALADREIFNLMSQRQLLLYEQNFPFLAVPTSGGQVSRIDISVHRAFGYNSTVGGGAPVYVSPSSDSIRVIDDQIASLVHQIRASAGLSRGSAEQSIASRSGEALLYETQDKAALLGDLARQAEDFERQLWPMVAKRAGQTFDGYVRYPPRYDVTRLGDDLDEVIKFFSVQPSPQVREEVLRVLDQKMLAHLPPEQLTAIEAKENLAVVAAVNVGPAATAGRAAPAREPGEGSSEEGDLFGEQH